MKPAPKSTAVEAEHAEFAAFQSSVEPVGDAGHAFTAFAAGPSRHLRTYEDCYNSEPEFVLVIGTEEAALMELETASVPVAHETMLKGADGNPKPDGAYRVWTDNGKRVMVAKPSRQPLNISALSPL